MRIIKAKAEIVRPQRWDEQTVAAIYGLIEEAGRTCYKSEGLAKDGSAAAFIQNAIRRGHESVLEHATMTVRFTVDRGISHEIVRHRIASYSQESTRYCNYAKDDFGNEITVIEPPFFREDGPSYHVWKEACKAAEKAYFDLLNIGETPEHARNVLPTSVKTEVVVTMNMREWRHFFRLRAIGTTGRPHPQMREVTLPFLHECQEHMPELFMDIGHGR